ncbi:MAG: hypothetical protein VX642_08645 [Bdellovibrionota bacterium]|nr:hypothetical protein [Bdellovibrionota bacterium]
MKKDLGLFLDYNWTYNGAKTIGFNYLGYIATGWPIWYFPEIHFYYKNSLSKEEKSEVDRILNSSTALPIPSALNKPIKTIKGFRRARKAFAMTIFLVSSGQAMGSLLEMIPLSYLLEGKDGLVELKLDRIEKDYRLKYGEEISSEYRNYLKGIEEDKELLKILLEIYKDFEGGESE